MKFCIAAILFFAPFSFAETQDDISTALRNTQSILNNPTERNKIIQGDPKAQEADRQLNSIAGSPENAQKIYELSSEILGNLVKSTSGNPDKMEELIKAAGKNPEAFANSFTPDQLEKIKALLPKPSPRF